MKKYKAVLVDDEASALKLLERKVRSLCSEIIIQGVFQKPESALEAIINDPPDILFLDIEMPRMNGFELLTEIRQIEFQVIFVTAYSEYALKALKGSAVDYILKPVDDSELLTAVKKATLAIEIKNYSVSQEKLIHILQESINRTQKIIVPTTKGLSFLPEKEVLYFEGFEGYTRIHLHGKQVITSSYNLGKFEKNLGTGFFKCHKSYIVNLEYVKAFENEGYLLMETDARIPISRSNRKIFLGLFN